MTEYRRASIPGTTWFFTVNLAERRDNRVWIDKLDELRWVCVYAKEWRSCRLEAVVIWPDHLQCMWTLPPDDTAFSTRWNVLKGHCSRSLEQGERISPSRDKRRERGRWQRWFWEPLWRDQADFNNPAIQNI